MEDDRFRKRVGRRQNPSRKAPSKRNVAQKFSSNFSPRLERTWVEMLAAFERKQLDPDGGSSEKQP